MIHTKKSSKATQNARPLIGMIIAGLPQAVRGERYMMMLTYSQKEAMIILDYKTGCQMMDVCREVDAATEMARLMRTMIWVTGYMR